MIFFFIKTSLVFRFIQKLIIASSVNWAQDPELLYLMLNLNSVPITDDVYLRQTNPQEISIRLDPYREAEGDLTPEELEHVEVPSPDS